MLRNPRKKTSVILAVAFALSAVASTSIVKVVRAEEQNVVKLTDEASIPKVISEMTLEEKARLVTGVRSSIGAAGNTYAIPRLGITSMELADGPAGVRLTGRYATAWPNPMMLASTWNTSLVGNIGEAVASEAKYYGVDIMLGPGMNLHRDPLGGRVFEYYSEDPYLTGKLSASYINSLQANGIGATIKHYMANNAENNRMNINEIISERTLRELYGTVWEIAVAESKPWAAMSAYNKINGTFASESLYVNNLLKNIYGFNGLIMSDWGAYKGPQAYKTGFDLNTPGTWGSGYSQVITAVNSGSLNDSDLNRAVESILKVVIKTETFKNQTYDKSSFAAKRQLSSELKAAGVKLSKEAALEGIVMLKNNNTLPLSKDTKTVGVAGKNAVPNVVPAVGWNAPTKGIIFEGGGSACVNVDINDVVSLVQGLQDGGLNIVQKNASGADLIEDMSDADAAYTVANSDVGIISIGRPGQEGSDVTSIDMKANEKELIKKLSDAYHAAGKKLIVLLNVAQPIEVASWEKYADAILYVGLPGTYGAEAIADILTGKENPSGKLVDSWPVKYSDLSTAGNTPASNQTEIEYKEGVYVGYRYFDTKSEAAPMYPFGYGLSYTTFKYSNIKLSKHSFDLRDENEKITATVDVTNTGNTAGKEVVQLYIHDNEASVDRPYKELKGFAKTKLLEPGEKQTVTFTINKRDLLYFDEKTSAEDDGQWAAEAGKFTVLIGGTSDTAELKTPGKGAVVEFNAVPLSTDKK